MVTKIHARGTSFKGAAAYLLHDKDRAATSTRVAWVETVNLATGSPESAWRVMAATAMDAPRLKDAAGVRKTGRASKDAVLHISLSWGPDQKPDRAEMASFARRALVSLKAGDRQAMIICHSDEQHPHVHLLVNRVSPSDGRLLSSSNEKNALSALALAYEQEGGQLLCGKRKENAERREQGEYVRSEKDVPRAEFEALREAHEAAEAQAPSRLTSDRAQDVAALRRQSLKTFREKLAQLREWLRPHWAGMYARQRQEKTGRQENVILQDEITKPLPAGGASLPFLRQKLRRIADFAGGQARSRAVERSRMAQAKRHAVAELVADLKTSYAQALGRLTGAYSQAARPASAASESGGLRTLTALEQRIEEARQRAANQNSQRPAHKRERDYER